MLYVLIRSGKQKAILCRKSFANITYVTNEMKVPVSVMLFVNWTPVLSIKRELHNDF
jgi:hypothetical protein